MRTIHDLPTPAALLDVDALERNLRRMAGRAGELGVALRPHAKTHKCVEVARAQRALGAHGLTVSTLYEARLFAEHGFDDLTWAFPIAPSRVAEARQLAERVRLGVLVDSATAVEALESSGFPFHVWLKVDCGYGRAGVDPEGPEALDLARRLAGSPTLQIAGLLTHSGHAYGARSPEHVREIAETERGVMAGLAERLRGGGIPVAEVSVGSTPAMARVERLDGVTEARPGNYALYDRTQAALGSCAVTECALTVLATVVSSRRDAGRAVLDAGALALSRDPGPEHLGPGSFGDIFDEYDGGTLRRDVRLTGLSQEHSVVDTFLPVGERVRILPNHACLTVACFDRLHVTRGEEVVDEWRVWRGR